jgi:anti-sigma factor (TIGR02949 family)
MPNNHPGCAGLLDSLSDYIDGQASQELCAELERHLAECEDCRILVDTTRRTIELYHARQDKGDQLPADVRDRLFRRLDIDHILGA